jgi:hypothetical protein
VEKTILLRFILPVGIMNVKSNDLHTKKPGQCHLWRQNEVTKNDLDFTVVHELIRSSHFDRFIVRCNRCSQLYIYEFVESGKWGGGDSINTVFIPIKDVDLYQMGKIPSTLLFSAKPRLEWTSDRLYWMGRDDASDDPS